MKVKIKETVEMIVEADSLEDAKEKYALGQYELYAETLKDVEFKVYKGEADGS